MVNGFEEGGMIMGGILDGDGWGKMNIVIGLWMVES